MIAINFLVYLSNVIHLCRNKKKQFQVNSFCFITKHVMGLQYLA